MRCLEKHWDQIFSGMPPGLAPSLKDNLVAVDVDNAVKWFFEKNSQEYWDYEQDLPCPLSPWPVAWFETGMPKYSNSDGHKVDLSSNNSFARKMGWLVWQLPLKKDIELPRENIVLKLVAMQIAQASKAASENLLRAHYDDEQLQAIKTRGPAFAQMGLLYAFTWADNVVPLMIEYAYHDASGAMIAKSRGLVLVIPNQELLTTEEQKRECARELEASFLALYFSLCLLHTKNVTVKHEPLPRVPKKHHDREVVNRTVFKVLDITPLKQEVRRASNGATSDTEIKRALHLCRGHYRRYTEDGKLFGKHTGIFWIPSHNRGSREAGEVRKDYRIQAPQ